MARQSLLISLLIVTLIVNVVLGIELYTALHQSSKPVSQVPLNLTGVQIITTTTSQKNTTSVTQTTTQSITSSLTYNFSFKVKFHLKVDQSGIYIIGIKPKVNFSSLYVLLYFDDGKTVSLNLNITSANITITDKEVEVTAYIYGSTNENLTPTQIVNDLGLYLQFISPVSGEGED
ncbi:hypothetical protein [Sulfurisphaera ohwakuensis]|uniref:Uncharacterized protein n=1 Tax=Sulfurisphaera ohwakuensis TaxID=69656 RepID=A0A650CFT4_SULOH|nr:hypothetical protein [Sulfurisphaera ohwakuensis]MBB5254105.1 hypothetical protein [Sulfurisphaera ohwakuensis]QGR16694.1 hypothetical protein D1869_05460 [Sulfurisphaera ohwakuensis]